MSPRLLTFFKLTSQRENFSNSRLYLPVPQLPNKISEHE